VNKFWSEKEETRTYLVLALRAEEELASPESSALSSSSYKLGKLLRLGLLLLAVECGLLGDGNSPSPTDADVADPPTERALDETECRLL